MLDEVRVFQLGLGEQQHESEYLKELDGIDVADIDYIYSEHRVRYIQSSTRGKTMFDGDTLENLIALLPKEDFFLAARHLIVSRRAIVSSERLADYTILLKLNPPTHLKTKLSELATRLFKSWYHDGGVNGLDN